ncbi:MAG: hypothetical protein LBI19_07590 [Oscillospiraceae bacterium]|nr:hypothetical protein [Oscillospiraceae bacterium]
MKKFAKSIESLLKNLFFLGQGGDVTFSKRQQAVLSRLGLDDFADLPPALVWMTTRTDANIATFSHCFFCKDYPYTTDIFARLLGESAFRKLVNWMLANGYERFDIYNVTASDCKVSLTIADPKWSSAPPNGGFEYKIKHTGISARLDPYVETPPVFGLCIPNGLKTYLEAFDVMNIELRRFVMRHTKQCDGCKFCVQTDKTGSRPLAYVTVGFENKNYRFCTYFPGYNYCWTQIDDALAENLMQMLAFMDTFASREKGGG